jgi:hypothetical protein
MVMKKKFLPATKPYRKKLKTAGMQTPEVRGNKGKMHAKTRIQQT